MRRFTVMAFALGLFAMLATPTFAQGAAGQNGSTNPSQACATNTLLVEVGPGEYFPLEVPSHGGCVSTVASRGATVAAGDYSHAAFVAQCKLLKDVLPPDLWNAPVNIIDTPDGPMNIGGFGGKINTCTDLLEGYHSGTLSHPE
jgi:hypothetical protein